MTPQPLSLGPNAPLGLALELLLSHDFTGLPVVDAQGRPLGLITDGDLVYRADIPLRVRLMARFSPHEVAALKANLSGRTVAEIMTAPAVSVGEQQYLGKAVALMMQKGLRRLPVVNDGGRLVGILSRRDIFQAMGQEAPHLASLAGQGVALAPSPRASQVMLTGTPTAATDTPLEQVIRLLGNSAVERVAVLDEKDRLLGLISDQALLGAFAEPKAGLWDLLMTKLSPSGTDRRQQELLSHYQQTRAEQVMQRDFVSVGPDTPLEEAASLMTQQRLKRLPVLDGQGRFLGMLSREALLRLEASPNSSGSGGAS